MMTETAPQTWRNRITGHGEEDPRKLLENPRNFRLHPQEQQEALLGVGAEQYSMGDKQKFEVMPLDQLLEYAEEELRDMAVYACMNHIRLRRLREALAQRQVAEVRVIDDIQLTEVSLTPQGPVVGGAIKIGERRQAA